MNILLNIGIVLLTFLMMEGVTWCTHKYVMHGFLWILHDDHHNKDHAKGFFERNDAFFIIFAGMAMSFFALGTFDATFRILVYIGMGITLYGFAYFMVHDVLIHQRLKWFSRTNNFYFRALRKAHKMHHKHLGKEDGECFGMLFVPMKYFKEALKTQR
jgi:beta-carotene 3-hydroxylase